MKYYINKILFQDKIQRITKINGDLTQHYNGGNSILNE